jgi:DinB superfamily
VRDDLRYPIGQPERHKHLLPEQREPLIKYVAELPDRLAAAVKGLDAAQLDTPYRAGGWTVRQVVHHFADSHMNAFVRFKLALTENMPKVKTYDESLWAETAEAKTAPVGLSLGLIEHLHARWTLLMRSLAPKDWARRFDHPERGIITLDENLCLYAWHCRHHVAHITALRERESWR